MAALIHSKTETGVWGLVPISGAVATLEISSIGISIPLIDLYENAMPADEPEALTTE